MKALVSVVLLAGFLHAASSLYEQVGFRVFSEELRAPELTPQKLLDRSTELFDQAHGNSSSFSGPLRHLFPSTDPRAYRAIAKYLYRFSNTATSLEARGESLCKALLSTTNAIEIEPDDPMTLVAWLELHTLLQVSGLPTDSESCQKVKGVRESVSSEQLLSYINEKSPLDPEIQFHVGRMAAQLGEVQLASKAFRKFLVASPRVEKFQSDFLIDFILSRQQVSEVLPAELPQIAFWSRRLLLSPDIASVDATTRQVLVEKQRQAVESRWQAVQRGNFPVEGFVTELVRLSELAASDAVRQELDSTIVHVGETFSQSLQTGRGVLSQRVAEFFSHRAKLRKLDVVVGWNDYDLKPDTGMLSAWGTSESLPLDVRYRSVGFVTGINQSAEMFSLSTDLPLTPEILPRLKVFFSDDNIQWTELSPSVIERELLTIEGRSVIALRLLEKNSARLWKVHYASKSDMKKLRAAPSQFLAVYGAKL